MKLAKKVFATVMAVAMILALSAMAFAAGTPTATLVADPVEDGMIAVHIYFKDAIGLKSVDTQITYDPAVLTYSYNEDGADAAQVGKTKGNSFTSEINPADGSIKWAGYFKTELTDAETFAKDSKKSSDPANVNAENFDAQVLYFEVKDATAPSTKIELAVSTASGVEIAGSSVDAVIAGQPPVDEPSSEEQPSSEEPSSEEKTSEDTASSETASVEEASKTPGKDVGPKTDASNWMIGAAAAVAVLAGAAFVVSKKRK